MPAVSMRVVEIPTFGPPSVLRLGTRPVPAPKADEVLIRVEAIGVCRPDSLQRRGRHPPPPGTTDVPGLKVAIAAGLLKEVWPKLPARHPIAPLIDSVHPLADVVKVHEYFDSGAHIGKIVLIP
jgi:NADPH:quinone reductase-like Zn-dependent oxidoreductase